MNKRIFIIIFFSILFIISYSILYDKHIEKKNAVEEAKEKINYAFKVKTKVTKVCNNKAKYYTEINNRKIYLYCLDEINIIDKTGTFTLKEKINNKENVIIEIMNTIDFIDTYKDGGSRMYRDNGTKGFTNNGLSIISCNTIEGNKDIYIGPKTMGYENNFCM